MVPSLWSIWLAGGVAALSWSAVGTGLDAIAAFLLVIVTALLLLVNRRMADANESVAEATSDMADATAEVATGTEAMARIESFRMYPDLQSRGVSWQKPEDERNVDLKLRIANVGGHRTAIERVRLVDEATGASAEYNLSLPEPRRYDTPARMNIVVEPGEIAVVMAGEAKQDGSVARRSDFENPRVEVKPVVGHVEPQGFIVPIDSAEGDDGDHR